MFLRSVGLVAIAITTLGLVACGGDDNGSPEDASALPAVEEPAGTTPDDQTPAGAPADDPNAQTPDGAQRDDVGAVTGFAERIWSALEAGGDAAVAEIEANLDGGLQLTEADRASLASCAPSGGNVELQDVQVDTAADSATVTIALLVTDDGGEPREDELVLQLSRAAGDEWRLAAVPDCPV